MSSEKDGPKLKAEVILTAPVYTTENAEKVRQAVSNIINYGRPKIEEILPKMISDANQKAEKSDLETEEINPFISDAAYREHIQQTAFVEGDLTLLTGLHYMIRKEEIIDTARSTLTEELSDDGCETAVLLNKQAAFMKHLSFPADLEPLGSIELKIRTKTPEDMLKIMDWLTPPTKDGIPVFELKLSDL